MKKYATNSHQFLFATGVALVMVLQACGGEEEAWEATDDQAKTDYLGNYSEQRPRIIYEKFSTDEMPGGLVPIGRWFFSSEVLQAVKGKQLIVRSPDHRVQQGQTNFKLSVEEHRLELGTTAGMEISYRTYKEAREAGPENEWIPLIPSDPLGFHTSIQYFAESNLIISDWISAVSPAQLLTSQGRNAHRTMNTDSFDIDCGTNCEFRIGALPLSDNGPIDQERFFMNLELENI